MLGIVAGAIYAITATGLVVTYKTTGVFNFAQGAVGMVAAFSLLAALAGLALDPVLSLVLVLLVVAPLLAVVGRVRPHAAPPRRPSSDR